jgi:hypothetical protein
MGSEAGSITSSIQPAILELERVYRKFKSLFPDGIPGRDPVIVIQQSRSPSLMGALTPHAGENRKGQEIKKHNRADRCNDRWSFSADINDAIHDRVSFAWREDFVFKVLSRTFESGTSEERGDAAARPATPEMGFDNCKRMAVDRYSSGRRERSCV